MTDDLILEPVAAAYRKIETASAEESARSRPLRFTPVLALALLLRAFAALLMFRSDPRTWFYNQASELTCLAHSILSGQGLSSPFGGSTGPSAFLAPGYPLLVALVYRIFGASSIRSAEILVSLHVAVGAMTVFTAMLVARRLFGDRIARTTGILCAICPTMIWLPALFWETALSTLFLIGGIAFALHCVDRPIRSTWLAFGASCAIAMLVNPALLVTFAGVGAWAAYRTRTVSRTTPLLAVAACALLFAAWPIRNAIELHAFVPLRSNLGYELWQGNRPGSQGLFTPEIYLNSDPNEYRSYATHGELAYIREKSAIAIAAIQADPRRFARLSLKRVAIFWTGMGGRGVSKIVICEITAASLLAIMALALLVRRRCPDAALLLVPFALFPLPYYLTHPDFRFRLLLQPIALLLTAWLAERCLQYWRSYRAARPPERDFTSVQ